MRRSIPPTLLGSANKMCVRAHIGEFPEGESRHVFWLFWLRLLFISCGETHLTEVGAQKKICRTGFVFSFFLKYRDRLGRMDSPQVHDFQLYDLLGSQPDVNLDLFSFNNPVEAADQLATSSVEHTSTPPKLSQTRSRNPRSCDFCRVRKTACIVEHALPCTTCRTRGFGCTFTKRRRKTRRTDLLGGSSGHSGIWYPEWKRLWEMLTKPL